MSEPIKHECGIAFIRLLKPLEYYHSVYNTAFYALNKLYLLMEKQHNRGQDGAGIASIKLDMPPGRPYMNRNRAGGEDAMKEIFKPVFEKIKALKAKHPERLNDVNWLKENMDFTGELFLGHLRYGTFGKNTLGSIHPFIRTNNWMSKNLIVAGNFNLTNVDELFNKLLSIGQHPVETTDTVTILEKIGYFLDEENEELYWKFKKKGYSKKDISPLIAKHLSVRNILGNSSKYWDGGYTIAGIFGHGDAFILRDPSGIRPAFYYKDDEIVIATSERPAIQTAFNVPLDKIRELKPGYALIVKKDGQIRESMIRNPTEKKSCSFERIYFSRGTDADIYTERKNLGKALVPPVLKAINHDFVNTVFSYIPNTALVAFYGLIEELNHRCNMIKREKLIQLHAKGTFTGEEIDKVLAFSPRFDNVAVKDIKLRTFITEDNQRDDLVAHVYDTTFGVINPGIDNLVILDDSIVRGTTFKQSIIHILDRLGPKKIIIASSAPQIRYPDCYGIDMSKLNDFVAFRAAIDLLKDSRQESVINMVYKRCKAQEGLPKEEIVNHVKEIYRPFSAEQISERIALLLKPKETRAEVQIIYQTIEDLHAAIPKHTGDWYFTGNYPTPGGNKVVNMAFINYIEGKHNVRSYGLF